METQETRNRRFKINRQVMSIGGIVCFLPPLLVHYHWLSNSVGAPLSICGLIFGVIFGLRGTH